MPTYRPNRGGRGVGLLIAFIGALFLLDQLNILRFGTILSTWWPGILLLLGVLRLRESRRLTGVVLLAIGTVFLLANLDVLSWNAIGRLWPVLLILAGLGIAFGRTPFGASAVQEVGADEFDVRAVFSGVERRITSQNLRAGAIEVLFGGAEIDLHGAKPAEDCRIRISATFGGVDLRVPEAWRLNITGTPIFGGIDDRTRQSDAEGPLVTIGCSAILGGIEIRN